MGRDDRPGQVAMSLAMERDEGPPIHPSCMHPSMHPSMHPCIVHPSVHARMHPPIYASMHASIHPSVYAAMHAPTHCSSICPCMHACVHPFVYASMHASIHPSVFPQVRIRSWTRRWALGSGSGARVPEIVCALPSIPRMTLGMLLHLPQLHFSHQQNRDDNGRWEDRAGSCA